jgi:CheY-like chemotaxis protein/anti-sigma regulatory factor (Ser/Thr protein kinase)
VHTDADVPERAWMDPVRMRQVLTNLIGNAIKFTDQGAVTVKTQVLSALDAQTVLLRISIMDTGIGFEPERTEALFSPFTQADGSVTRAFGGTGLGLAITRSLLQLMGGFITAEGRPGRGATFEATLPIKTIPSSDALDRAAWPVEPAAGESSQARPASAGAVLLVEDHEINRKLAEIMLQRMGYRYVTACDGLQALDMLDKNRFDVVLMDVMMPVMDGLTALKLLRERESEQGRRTPVLMVTAHAMTGDRERFLSAGADGYVSKPMSQAALQKEIERILKVQGSQDDVTPT